MNSINRVVEENIVSVAQLTKIYGSGLKALDNINLDIKRGEILALLGPNGAGKTTLISSICGIANVTQGSITVDGKDIRKDYRYTRYRIGLVPQELTTGAFESVWSTVSFSRGLFGRAPNPDYIEKILKDLSLWDKKDAMIMMLSGGMKRRVLIAKALAHEPSILFLDEPSAGVDVELRQDMWRMIETLRASGVTIVLTTHYIEEAEVLADRIGIINKGKLIELKKKSELMSGLGKKQLTLYLVEALTVIPDLLKEFDCVLENDGHQLVFTFNAKSAGNEAAFFLSCVQKAEIMYSDIDTKKSSLEDIFVQLLREGDE